MPNLTSISIPKPCNQSWRQMAPAAKGSHCQSCCKMVIDFTKMTNSEILQNLATNNNQCGRFEQIQLNNINTQLHLKHQTVDRIFKRSVIAIGLLWSSVSLKTEAQTKAPVSQIITDTLKFKSKEKATDDQITTPLYREIKGHVTAVNDTLPFPGVSVYIMNSLQTTTDSNSNFRIKVPLTATTFTIRYIGYELQTVNIIPGKLNYIIIMKESPIVMGEVVIKRPTFLKRVYYRFIKRPIRRIFHS